MEKDVVLEKLSKFWLIALLLGSCLGVTGCSFVLGRQDVITSPSTSSQTVVKGDLAEQIDAFMANQASHGYAGALLIEQNGELILAKGYGVSDRATSTPVTPDTVFDIGSVTKQFTAAAILKLEEQKQLKVEDAISNYFANVPADKQDITLHQLLTHTAGLPESLGDDYDRILKDDYIDLAMRTPLLHQPGEAYSYSNTGYSLLTAIIEQVTGQSYEAYLREVLFEPIGMLQTGYLLPEWQEDHLAHAYTTILFWPRDMGTPLDQPFAADGPYWHLRGNGGILSTVLDMYQWHKALQGNTVLTEASKAKLLTPYVDEGFAEESFYSYGWVIIPTSRGTTLQTHNGGNDFFYADIHRYVDDDVMLFITSSAGQPDATELSWQIADMLFKRL